ncbi:integrin alpha-6-like isoform 1-T1 [Synchiropus picturatus]
MAPALTCGLWLLGLLLGAGPVRSFNLDTDNVQRKNGDRDSLFGFSLAMHRQLQPQDKRLLLVGAPRAAALAGQRSQVTGGVYSCDMASSSTSCTRIIFDDDEDLKTESKENQWMGVTVKSQGPGGKILTCAHRYQRRANVGNKKEEARHIIGRCYVLSQDFQIRSSEDDEGGRWQFCDGRNYGHMLFGSCQQGLSATFDKDYHYLIFGAPGAYNWKGIVRAEQNNNTLLFMGIYDDGPFETGDELQKEPHLVPAPDSSYLGFSLDTGMSLTKRKHLTVVAGAPRAYHSGAVVLLTKGAQTSKILLEEYTLKGPGLASSFGYDLTVLDLNNDGWDDLVVGAPQYYEKDSEIGGAIFIYINNGGDWNSPTPTKLNGPQNSMFGLSVETLGDINQDGFDDFAVGAPYADDGAGKVFVYHGSTEAPEEAAQEISGKPLNVKQFGYSLAGNMDLDENSLPDMAVGSLSDAIFVFKARPVINIKKQIRFSPQEIDLTNKNCGENFCLTIEACFSYTANPANYSPRLKVEYNLEADAVLREKGLLSRAYFIADGKKSHSSVGTVTIEGKGNDQCITRVLTMKDDIRDKLHGLPIDVSVNIQGADRKRRQASGLTPVLDKKAPATTRSEVQFRKEGCGSNNICESDLQVKYRFGNKPTDNDPFTPLELQNGVPVLTLSDQKIIALEVTVTNKNADDAHEASLIFSLPRYLPYGGYNSPLSEKQVSCKPNRNGSKVDCELGNPFKRDAETTFYITMGAAGITLNNSEIEVDLLLETTSKQTISPLKAKAKVAIVLQLSVTGQAQPSQVYFSQNTKGESAMKSEGDIGSLIMHQFRIINLGKPLAQFGTATLTIDWPKEIDNKKWLLYLTKISHSGVKNVECTPKEEINPLKKLPSRSKRAADKDNESTLSRLVDSRKSKTVTCGDGAKCVTMKCPLLDMDSNAIITLHSRLWDPTLAQHFSSYHYVEVKVKAFLEVASTAKNTVLKNSETEVRLTLFPERHEAQSGGVPWWIIVLTILLLLLLLALLAFLLWKCGSVKRAKYEDKVPSHSAVRIKRDERVVRPGNVDWENMDMNPWKRTWHSDGHYS